MDTSENTYSLGKNIPAIRFPDFNEDWKHVRLNELLKVSAKRNGDLKYSKAEVLSVSGELGVVNQIGHLGRSYAGESVHNYHVVEKGSIVYTKSPLKANPYGIIKINKGEPGIVSTLYAVYEVIDNTAHGQFIDYYFSLDKNVNRYLRPLVKKGAKNDMKINNTYVLNDKIFAPSLLEQKAISSFLELFDIRINQLKEKKSLLEIYFKGVLQQIFSQKLKLTNEQGDDFPEWEFKALKDIAKKVKTKNKSNDINFVLTNSATRGIISQQDYFDKDIANQENLAGYYIVEVDDFVYNPRISVSAPVGPIKRNKLVRGVMSPLYTVFRFNELNPKFLELFFETHIWHSHMKSAANYGARHDRMSISNEDFFQLPIPLPSVEEQSKIVSFLSAIEDRIHCVTSLLENSIQYKKGLLQQMFVS